MENMTFIEKFGALILAVIALMQPWILFLWKKFIKQGKVKFFETGNLEIGFSSFASTVGINGTLRAIDKDFYVSGISLELTKEKDSSKHYFDWAVFRDTKLSLSGKNDRDVELPYGILLTTQSPQRVNIQFHDRKQQEEMRPIYDKLSLNWQNYLDGLFPYEKRRLSQNLENEIYILFDEFTKTTDSSNAYIELNREFYWEKGNYSLHLNIQTSQPDKLFFKTFNFSLTDEECKYIRYNVITLDDLACGQSRFPWQFAYPNFKK